MSISRLNPHAIEVKSIISTMGVSRNSLLSYAYRRSPTYPTKDEMRERLEKVIEKRFKRELTDKQMEKLYELYTKDCDNVTKRIERAASLGSALRSVYLVRLEIEPLLRLCDKMVKNIKKDCPDERTF